MILPSMKNTTLSTHITTVLNIREIHDTKKIYIMHVCEYEKYVNNYTYVYICIFIYVYYNIHNIHINFIILNIYLYLNVLYINIYV